MKTQAIYELVGAQADRSPESIALAAPGRLPVTYVELASQVRGVGRALHGLGIGRNDAVIIVLPHGPELVTTCIGVAAYATAVPLDPSCRRDTVEHAFSSTEPKAVFVARRTASAALDIAYALGTAVVELDFDPAVAGCVYAATATADVSAVPLPAQAGDDAFMLPTCGPDRHFAAVALTHHEICSAARELASKLELSNDDRCLNLTPIWKWRGSIGDVVATFTAGGTVVCPPSFDSALDFFEWVRECQPTWFTAEAAVHEVILEAVGANRDVLEQSAIRFVQASASDISHDLQVGLESAYHVPVIERTLGL